LIVARRVELDRHTCRRPSRRFPHRPQITFSRGLMVTAAASHGIDPDRIRGNRRYIATAQASSTPARSGRCGGLVFALAGPCRASTTS
jgi:hypothetical protein